MSDRRRRQLPAAVGRVVRQQLAGLEAERLMAVDDALRVAGGARGERDQRRARRIGGDGADQRLIGEQVVEVRSPTRPTIGTSAQRSGWNFIRPNSSAVMNTFGRAVAMMWLEFPAAVEVHDRHHHRPEQRRRPERHSRFHPVRQLDGHRVARLDATRAQACGKSAGLQLDVGEGACIRAGRPSAPRSRCRGWPPVRRRSDHRASRAATTLLPRSVSSALPGFFASRAAAPPFGRDAILRSRECQYRRRRMPDGRPRVG